MIDHDDAIESASVELGEARRMIEEACTALQRALDEGGESDVTRRIAARLERMAAEVARIERACADARSVNRPVGTGPAYSSVSR
jgi:hypothetical protein